MGSGFSIDELGAIFTTLPWKTRATLQLIAGSVVNDESREGERATASAFADSPLPERCSRLEIHDLQFLGTAAHTTAAAAACDASRRSILVFNGIHHRTPDGTHPHSNRCLQIQQQSFSQLQPSGSTRELQLESGKPTSNFSRNSESGEIRGRYSSILVNPRASSLAIPIRMAVRGRCCPILAPEIRSPHREDRLPMLEKNSKSGGGTRSLQPLSSNPPAILLTTLNHARDEVVVARFLQMHHQIPLATPNRAVIRGRCSPIFTNITSISSRNSNTSGATRSLQPNSYNNNQQFLSPLQLRQSYEVAATRFSQLQLSC